jgi:hypothetical protein
MDWERDKHLIANAYYDCIKCNNDQLFSVLSRFDSEAKRIRPIIKFIDDRLSCVWFLANNDKLWDADIINRSALEALLKLMFFTNVPDENVY